MLYGELISGTQDLVAEIDKGSVITQSKEVTPSTEKIVVVPDSGYYLSQVSVKGVTSDIDPNIKADNIRLGTSILGVEGNLAPDKPDQEKSVVPSKLEQEVVADTGYELAKVVVKATPLEELSVSEDGTYEPSGDNIGFSKVVVSVGGELSSVVEVPEELQNQRTDGMNTYYYYDIGNNEYLVSFAKNAVNKNGIWRLNVSTGTFEKLYDADYGYDLFVQVEEEIILSASSSVPFIKYNTITREVTQIIINGFARKTALTSAYSLGNKVLLSNTNNGKTLYVYDYITKDVTTFATINLINSVHYSWQNKAFITTRNTSAPNELLIYNADTNTLTTISGNEGLTRQLSFANAKENIVTFSNSATTVLGFYWLDLDTETFTHAENEIVDTIQINQTAILDNGVVLVGRLNTLGVYAYDTGTKTYIAENADSGLGYSNLSNNKNIVELNDYVLYSRSSGGLWQYNKANNAFTQLTTSAGDYVMLTNLIQNNSVLLIRFGLGLIYAYNNAQLSSNLYGTSSSTTYEVVEVNEDYVKINDNKRATQLTYYVANNIIKSTGIIL